MKFAFFVINLSLGTSSMKQVYDDGMEQVEWGEELGYDALFVAEHAFFHYGKPSPHVLLGNIAACTKRIRIGTGVSILPWHNPIEIAQDYATVDLLSDGRFDFGVGRGLFRGEFEGYRVPWQEAQERFDESLDVILKAWTENPFSYKGKFHSYPEVEVLPKPLQKTPPTAIAALPQPVDYGEVFTPIIGASLTQLTDLKVMFERLSTVMEQTGITHMEKVAHPFIYVSDTIEKAREQAREPTQWFLDDFGRMFALLEGME